MGTGLQGGKNEVSVRGNYNDGVGEKTCVGGKGETEALAYARHA
jgi:hypothetical protein